MLCVEISHFISQTSNKIKHLNNQEVETFARLTPKTMASRKERARKIFRYDLLVYTL